jgi:hypothetical protein
VDAQVYPWAVLDALYAEYVDVADGSPVCPRTLLTHDEAKWKRAGELGSVMVVSIELPDGDDLSPHEALKQVCGPPFSFCCLISDSFL